MKTREFTATVPGRRWGWLVCVFALGCGVGPKVGDSGTVVVSSTALGTTQLQLSTNDVWSGLLNQFPNAVQSFKALHDPLVRIHVGDDGFPEAMPELNYNQWDFTALDVLVRDVTATGQQPLMNIKFAPDFMWTCYPNSVGINGTHGVGTVSDMTFQTYAAYMARLVRYYNLGSMTTESGAVVTNPAGTANRITYWELWNEPDLNIETPCAPSNGLGITSDQYVTMWNAVTAAMLKVDPTLKFVGPAGAGGQFGSSSASGNVYIDKLMAGATVKPAAISFHGYGYWDNTVTDQTIFDGDSTGAGGIGPGIVTPAQSIANAYPGIPLFLTEVNVNAAWGNDTYQRPWTAFGAAWWGTLVAQLAPLGVALINQFDIIDGPQFGLLDETAGNPRLPYWVQVVLDQGLQPGSQVLQTTSSLGGIVSLAVKRTDGSIAVLVVDRRVNSSSTTGGPGLPATVSVQLPFSPRGVTVRQLDSTTSISQGPTTLALPAAQSETISFNGYGMAVLTAIP